MIKYLVVAFCLLSFGLRAQNDRDIQQIQKILQEQTQAWNRADPEAFMQAYWHSDSLRFIGKRGITYGWQNTLDNYKKNYPDQQAMGILRFEILSIEKLSSKVVFVIGKWQLQRSTDQPGGYFSLLWKKIRGQWVIVADHSS